MTGYSCPSCGTTRAILLFFKGEIMESIYSNPFGIILISIMTVSPLWIIYDLLTNRETFYVVYHKIEQRFRQKRVAIILVVIVLLNWIFNLIKEA